MYKVKLYVSDAEILLQFFLLRTSLELCATPWLDPLQERKVSRFWQEPQEEKKTQPYEGSARFIYVRVI